MPMRIREITKNDREHLEQLTSCPDQAAANRARTLLMASDGMDAVAIAQLLRISERTIRYIVKRFNDGGLQAVQQKTSFGRPRLISESQRESLIAIIRCSPEEYGIPTKLWNCADILAAARSEGVLGDVSYWTFRREVDRILDINPDLRSRANIVDQKRPGAPCGNRNALRHGAYASHELSCEDCALFADIEARFLADFPSSDDTGIKLIRDAAEAYLMFLRAASADCADATSRADRRLKKAIKTLKTKARQQKDAPKITLAEWASDLLRRFREIGGKSKTQSLNVFFCTMRQRFQVRRGVGAPEPFSCCPHRFV